MQWLMQKNAKREIQRVCSNGPETTVSDVKRKSKSDATFYFEIKSLFVEFVLKGLVRDRQGIFEY